MKILQYATVLLCVLTLWGCSKGNAGSPIDPATGKHVAGWAEFGTGGSHVAAFFANPALCEGCHGKTDDPAGGIVALSCSVNNANCHSGQWPHGSGFSAPNLHGTGKAITAAGSTSGMAFCKNCHGDNYTGGTITSVSCIGCHRLNGSNPNTNAPHAGNWATYLNNPNRYNHSATDPSNAPACAQCHTNKSNLSATGVSIVASFTTPGTGGCFDNSLCHNQPRHKLPFADPVDHGVAARKNLSSCGRMPSCHGSSTTPPRFNGKPNNTTNPNVASGCETCHTRPGLAHPWKWLKQLGTVTSATHADATIGTNGSYCTPCHNDGLVGGLTVSGTNPAVVIPSCGGGTGFGGAMFGINCHLASPAAKPRCSSCHGYPPDNALPVGSAAPNRDFRHSKHFTNIGATLTCDVCHETYGSGNLSHATTTVFAGFTAPVKIAARFYENNVAASYSATGTFATNQRCLNVSCHGGLRSVPQWKNPGDLPQDQCVVCHTVQQDVGLTPSEYIADPTKPYIGPFSGNIYSTNNQWTNGHNLHTVHIKVVAAINGQPQTACAVCHNMPAGPAHYGGATRGRRALPPGFAKNTLTGSPGVVLYSYSSPTRNAPSCKVNAYVSASGTQIGCHNFEDRSWYK